MKKYNYDNEIYLEAWLFGGRYRSPYKTVDPHINSYYKFILDLTNESILIFAKKRGYNEKI